MHLRIATVRRGSKVYRYAQIVESYRRESDGKPTSRVIASLGSLDDVAISNLRAALAANRGGDPLVLPSREEASLEAEVLESLQYLDVAVLLRIWEQVGLGSLLRDLLPSSESITAEVERVVAALVLHRCVAAGSTLSAERWFPTTALPELLAITPQQFNNSRLHRALNALEAVDGMLQDRLPSTLAPKAPAFATVFIDATDTWFEGRGPPLAAKGIDKEGLYRRRVGVVLVCDEHGLPLRWHTLSGRYHDATALLDMAAEVAKLPWMKGTTVVLDRAVGTATHIEQLAATELRFLTALPYIEFASAGAPVEWAQVEALQAACRAHPGDAAAIAAAAAAASFLRVRDDRYVLDLRVFAKARPKRSRPTAAVAAVQRAQLIQAHPHERAEDLADLLGRSVRRVRSDRHLCNLKPELQARVLAGEADGVSTQALEAIAKAPADDQLAAFEATIARMPATRPKRARLESIPHKQELRTRGVLCFNPALFGRQAQAESKKVRLVEMCARRINQALAAPASKRTNSAILAEIDGVIRRAKLGDVYEAKVVSTGGTRRLVIDEDQSAWERRRRAYGITLLVGHGSLAQPAAELVALYYSKDAVEKDFQTIKSVTELRPVHHRTDPKLRAHVTLCMLALLLDRTLALRAKAAGTNGTAVALLDSLRPVHLNHVRQRGRTFYTVTKTTPAQQACIAALGLAGLAENGEVRKKITPR